MTWREFIADAPDTQRGDVYRRALRHGFTYRQIAEAAGVAVSTVYVVAAYRPAAKSLDDPIPTPTRSEVSEWSSTPTN